MSGRVCFTLCGRFLRQKSTHNSPKHLATIGARRHRGGTTAASNSPRSETDKKAQAEAYLRSFDSDDGVDVAGAAQHAKDLAKKAEEDEKELAIVLEEQNRLLAEAGAMTRSLYRTCIRCTKVLLRGNEHDEKDFQEREEQQFKALQEGSGLDMFSMAPPVDREDELSSRTEYYHAYARENFVQESDCFRHSKLWREENVDRYLHFLRNGEHQRQWIMDDYKFEDPYTNKFDSERVNAFEKQAKELLKRIYRLKDWKFVEQIREEERLAAEAEDDFDDHDDTHEDQVDK